MPERHEKATAAPFLKGIVKKPERPGALRLFRKARAEARESRGLDRQGALRRRLRDGPPLPMEEQKNLSSEEIELDVSADGALADRAENRSGIGFHTAIRERTVNSFRLVTSSLIHSHEIFCRLS